MSSLCRYFGLWAHSIRSASGRCLAIRASSSVSLYAIGLGQEDVVGALQVLDGLAKDPPGKEVPVAKGVRLVDQEQVESAL